MNLYLAKSTEGRDAMNGYYPSSASVLFFTGLNVTEKRITSVFSYFLLVVS